MKPDFRTFLEDANEAAAAISVYISGTDLDGFLANPLLQDAVERRLMVLGEALSCLERLSPETAEQIPNKKEVIGLRDQLVHEYRRGEPSEIWNAVKCRLPMQRRTFRWLLAELEREAAA